MPSSAYRSFLGATLAWPLVAALSVAAARAETLDEDPPDPLTLTWCLERAARVNPELAMDAADAEAPTAGRGATRHYATKATSRIKWSPSIARASSSA